MTVAPYPEPRAQDAGEVLLDVADLEVVFDTPEGRVHAVNGVSFVLRRGETLAILGESGCGKSVATQAIMGLVASPPGRVSATHVRYRDMDLRAASPSALRRVRGRKIAMIFQDPITSLDPGKTVGFQIAEVFRIHLGVGRREARRKAIELLERVRIPSAADRVDDYPHQFSGGMSQRVMIAMAIALDPEILIADEPTTALDVTVQAQIMELIAELQRESGMAVMLITHDLALAAEHADRVAVMYAGRVVETGPMCEIHRRPAHPYTRGLLGSVPSVSHKGGRLTVIGGSPPVLSTPPRACAFHPRCDWRQAVCTTEVPPLAPVDVHRSSACFFAEEVQDA